MRVLLYTIVARIRGFVRGDAQSVEFDEELSAHLAMAEDDLVRQGLTRHEARRRARMALGGLTQLREASRAASGLPWLESLSLDVRLGVRLLSKYPGLTLVSTLALAVAIAVVAGFHAGTEFIVRPTLPVPGGDRIVALWNHDVRTADRGRQTVGDMLTWRREMALLQDVGAFLLRERVVVAPDGGTRLVRAAEISPSVFQAVRVPPLLGRPLVAEDERPGSAGVAVVGFDVWQSTFGGDPGLVGKPILVGGLEHTVVGIMPAGYRFPTSEQLWTPLRVDSDGLGPGEGGEVEFAVARLPEGVSQDKAAAELEVVGSRVAAGLPQTHGTLRPRMTGYARALIDSSQPWLVQSMSVARVLIGLVLLVTAVNVGTLVYARDAARVGEVAVRRALGASRSRIAVQMFLEALVLASLSAAAGLAFMAWPLSLLRRVFEIAEAGGDGVPFWWDVRLGPETLLLVAGLVLVTAALTGVLPALKLTGRGTGAALRHASAAVSGLRFGKAATAAIVSQVAMSMALLTIGAFQLHGFIDDWAALRDGGMRREEYLTAQLRWDLAAPADSAPVSGAAPQRRRDAWRALGQHLSGEPDVRGVTFAAFMGVRPFAPAGAVQRPTEGRRWTWLVSTEPNYFDVYGTPIRGGRAFDAADVADETRRIAIVNEEFVRVVLGAGPALGRRIHPVEPQTGRPAGEPLEIVGIVQDSLNLELSEKGPAWAAFPTVFVPLRATLSPIQMTVRAEGDPSRIAGRLHAAAAGIDPALAVHQPRSLDDAERIDLLFVRLYGISVGFLVAAVLVLSTAGVYAMFSFTVSQRTREIGIRTAIGASPRRVVGEVFSRAFVQLGSGIVFGLMVGVAAVAGPFRLADASLEDVGGVSLGVGTIMLLTGLIACGTPLRRALRIQPTDALRAD